MRQAGKWMIFIAALGLFPVLNHITQSATRPPTPNPQPPSFPPLRFAKSSYLFVEPTRTSVLTAVKVLPLRAHSSNIAVNPRTNRLYLASADKETHSKWFMAVIDGRSDQVLTTVPLPEGASYLSVNSATNRVYASAGNKLLVFDGASNKLLSPLPHFTGMLFIDSDANRLYAASPEGLVVLDGRTHAVLKRLPNILIGGIAVNTKTQSLYITQRYQQNMLVLNSVTYARKQVILFPKPKRAGTPGPERIAINPNTNRLYVTHDNFLYVMDARTHKVLQKIPFEHSPSSVVINPITNRLFVSGLDYRLFVIDGRNNKVVAKPTFDDAPSQIVVNPQTSKVYVCLSCGIVVILTEMLRR